MATYRDQRLECASCGKFFFFTVTDQRRLEQEGKELVAPTLCPTCHHRDPTTGKQCGRIKWFQLRKGYGFVRAAGGEEFFFHRTRTLETDLSKLKEGAEVLFEVAVTPKGSEAIQVELVDGGAPKPVSPEQEDMEGELGLAPTP